MPVVEFDDFAEARASTNFSKVIQLGQLLRWKQTFVRVMKNYRKLTM
jgi:hypothetical protein